VGGPRSEEPVEREEPAREPPAAQVPPPRPGGRVPQEWRGQRLGLPRGGPGALAPAGLRLAAFAVDAILSALVAGLFTAPELPRNWSLLVFVVAYSAFTAVFGQTPGMRLLGLRVIRVDRAARVGLRRGVIRTLLLAMLVPALIWDADTRCLHDRLTDTAVVRA
jgi:uncharacterized RDD family membrane protein YckC